MKIKKQPQFRAREPNYPSLGEAKIERRRFLYILGGTTSAVVLSACNDKSKDFPEDEGSEPDDDEGSGAWDDDDGVDGDVGPEDLYFNIRLPYENDRVTQLEDGSEITYFIWMSYEGQRELGLELVEELLKITDFVLSQFRTEDFWYAQGIETIDERLYGALCEHAGSEAFNEVLSARLGMWKIVPDDDCDSDTEFDAGPQEDAGFY